MSKQNIYDNDAFFQNFKSIRDCDINFNDLIETPILSAMLPDLHNKKILDIGCGMGQHAKFRLQKIDNYFFVLSCCCDVSLSHFNKML